MCCSWELKNLIIEGNNLSVIQAIKRIWKIPWSINDLISDAEKVLTLTSLIPIISNMCFVKQMQLLTGW